MLCPFAGRGARRAPYDSICNMEGLTLRRLAEQMPGGEAEDIADASHAGVGSIKELVARCICMPISVTPLSRISSG